jgi:hypothetical protein
VGEILELMWWRQWNFCDLHPQPSKRNVVMETKKYTNEDNNGNPKNRENELCYDVIFSTIEVKKCLNKKRF